MPASCLMQPLKKSELPDVLTWYVLLAILLTLHIWPTRKSSWPRFKLWPESSHFSQPPCYHPDSGHHHLSSTCQQSPPNWSPASTFSAKSCSEHSSQNDLFKCNSDQFSSYYQNLVVTSHFTQHKSQSPQKGTGSPIWSTCFLHPSITSLTSYSSTCLPLTLTHSALV